MQVLIKEFKGVAVKKDLKVSLTPAEETAQSARC